jgi:two-component system, OmpR family, copper resistance phosphate regulon response regulator CusR
MAKILVVEDSSLMKVYLRRCLENHHHEVEDWTPMSAMEVADKITSVAPDLVITDYLMEGCNGATIARLVQKTNPKIPVIGITANRDDDIAANMNKFNVRRILYKPVEVETLIEAVNAVLHEIGKA